jgi:hypothetical protein
MLVETSEFPEVFYNITENVCNMGGGVAGLDASFVSDP